MDLYLQTSYKLSKLLTQSYSTSFSLGSRLFPKEIQKAIYSLYGFVRLADEIVDTFQRQDIAKMLADFRDETYTAIEKKISINPILHAFQNTVHQYALKKEYIDAFLYSMELDLTEKSYDRQLYDQYVYGSAEVVGLMCLQIFCYNETGLFDQLLESARKLGSAFQKVNFLRDIKSDLETRRRIYLPDIHDKNNISNEQKQKLESEISLEFKEALIGIRQLPMLVRFGVYTAYLYYHKLFKRIQRRNVSELFKERVRISNGYKTVLLVQSYFTVKGFSK